MIYRRFLGCLALIGLAATAACATTDIPMVTKIEGQRGYSMMGYAGTADEAVARQKILHRLKGVCPTGARIVDLKLDRADAMIGTKMLRYEVLATCPGQ